MRDYGKVTPKFWTGKTGKELRKHRDEQLLALYLMTSPHAEMTGVYYCPVEYMSHETGIPLEGAMKALDSLIQRGFCEYDKGAETVFVIRMAAFQIGDSLKDNDNRVAGVRKMVDAMPEGRIKTRFLEVYAEAYHLQDMLDTSSPSEAPPKPGAGTGAGTGAGKGAPSKKPKPRKSTIPDDFGISDRVKAWAEKNGHNRLDEHLEAFKRKCKAKGYEYASFDDAFMEAVRENWAKLETKAPRRERML